jgi:hypothetical protein
MYLQKVGLVEMEWIDLVQERDSWQAVVSAVMNLQGSIKYRELLHELRTC